MRTSLVEVAQQKIKDVLQPGGIAIDATMGNGYDTLFLARTVGEHGKVFAFDIQQSAIDNTDARLKRENIKTQVRLNLCSHGALLDGVESLYSGQIKAVMFNLGYLPGSDKRIRSQPDQVLLALKTALTLLSAGGCISVLAYTGHAGGKDEAQAVKAWVTTLPQHKYKWEITAPPEMRNPPVLIMIYHVAGSQKNGDANTAI